ncbi:hypothetical protein LTR95_005151 [Oleoguttula sp. CCFEE 5521]
MAPFHFPRSLVATLILLSQSSLAQSDTSNYKVWSSVIFQRIGERTPDVLGFIPTTLTSLGAQQAHNAGSFFRERYVPSAPSVIGTARAAIDGLNANTPSPQEVYALALDTQSSVATAQAFLQGLYPPFTLNESVAAVLDPTSVLANGSYIESPLGGYQYIQLHTSGALDPEFPYLAGSLNCPAYDYNQVNYLMSAAYASTDNSSSSVYDAIDDTLLASVMSNSQADYINAYAIYDYVNYYANHNASFKAQINDSTLNALRWLADEQQYAMLGNLNAYNNLTSSSVLPDGKAGSIATLGGNLLLAKMLDQLQTSVQWEGEYYKLSLLFADFPSLVSMFALLGLPDLNSNFAGLPSFASSAVFEVFSTSDNATYPSEDDLWVRFYFRNGTDSEDAYQSYPIFRHGPSETDMRWSDFQTSMNGVLIGSIGDWCTQCEAVTSVFCAAWGNSTTSSGSTSSSSSSTNRGRSHSMSPAVAGVIGAIVALVIAGLIFGLLALIGGFRVHRNNKYDTKKDLGGFKGSQKLASDRDLTLPKGGAVVGATVERDAMGGTGHERIGSWELKKADMGSGGMERVRPSFEDDDRVNPFRDPVKADERV